jgi:hypothetical protein
MTLRPPPSTCPVCGDALHTTRLSCDGCDTELTGHFAGCEYCALGAEDRRILRLFLSSRGNVKDVERALAVSYPTARARVDAVLAKLGVIDASGEPSPGDAASSWTSPSAGPSSSPGRAPLPAIPPVPPLPPVPAPRAPRGDRVAMLQRLASGEIGVDDALEQL